MFDVIVYKNLSATNVVDKNLQQPPLNTLPGVLRDGSSLLDPVIELQATQPGFHANQANYLHIPEFGRYYFITNIISTHNQLWEIHAHVDVLMSYKDLIRQQEAIIARQERQYNLYLDDGVFMCYQNPKFQTKTFSNPTPFEAQEFVLVVAGS